MSVVVTWAKIKAMRPCTGRYEACRSFIDLPGDEEWPLSRLLDMPDKRHALSDALWVLRRLPGGSRACVSLAADLAERVLHLYESEYPGDDRPRKAIEAARAWAANPCPETDIAREAARVAARGAARDAARDATDATRSAAWAAWAAWAVADTAWPAWFAADAAAVAAQDAAEELAWQINRLREVLNGMGH